MKKQFISFLLALVMILSVIPAVSAVEMNENGEYIFTDSRGNEVVVPENAFATRVVSTDTGKKWTIYEENKNTDNILGSPYDENGKSKTSYCLGNYGSIVLEFSVDIVDNEGIDIYVFEVGNEVEPTSVEVSVDGSEWIYVGDADGSLSGVDLAGKVPAGARYHYVRLTDLGTDANYQWPGADINAVAGLNVKNIPFRDLPLDAYYYGPVTWAYDTEITLGVGDEKFDPDASCKRQDVVTYLWRLNGKPEATVTACPFEDVPEDAYYYDAVLWGYENGVILGVDDTHFAPERNIKRCEFVALLYRNMGNPEYTVENPFVDIAEDAYYYDAVLWGYEVGITKGMDDTHFAPEDQCTRAQVVTFLYRFDQLDKTETEEDEDSAESTATEPDATEPAPEMKDVVLQLGCSDISLTVGVSFEIPLDCDLSYEEIAWSVAHENIATVENGVVTAVSDGMTEVTAKYGDQEVTCIIRCNAR